MPKVRSVCLLFEDESDRAQSRFKASSWASKDCVLAGLRRAMVAVLRELSGLPAAVIGNRKDGTPKKGSVARRPAKLL